MCGRLLPVRHCHLHILIESAHPPTRVQPGCLLSPVRSLRMTKCLSQMCGRVLILPLRSHKSMRVKCGLIPTCLFALAGVHCGDEVLSKDKDRHYESLASRGFRTRSPPVFPATTSMDFSFSCSLSGSSSPSTITGEVWQGLGWLTESSRAVA